jgi:septal ring factor EnvC (AmiA/AmiB activator)
MHENRPYVFLTKIPRRAAAVFLLTKIPRRAAIVFLLAAHLTWWPAAVGSQEKDLDDKIKSKEEQLQKLRDDIADQRRKIADIEKREKNEIEYLRRLEREEKLTRRLLTGLGEKENMYDQQAGALRKDLESNEEVYKHRLGILSRRLREMYKEGRKEMWQELLNASDFSDLMQRYKFLTLIAERDADLVKDVRERGAEIERQEAAITEALHEVTVAKQEKQAELGKLRENERKRKATLNDLGSSKQAYQKRIAELAESQKKLLDFIEELERRRLEQAKDWASYGERDFAGLKGRLIHPIEGKTVREYGRFKHPEFGTVTFNSGIDIEARADAPVRAVAKGRVEYVDALPGYGNCIIVNHGNGYYTLYAHADRSLVKQGEKVEAGSVIAEVGRGAESPFHFEIRKSKEALDPRDWLRK